MKGKKPKDLLPKCSTCGCTRYNICSCNKPDKKSQTYKRKINKENHKNSLHRS